MGVRAVRGEMSYSGETENDAGGVTVRTVTGLKNQTDCGFALNRY